jgi:hypothetical protein
MNEHSIILIELYSLHLTNVYIVNVRVGIIDDCVFRPHMPVNYFCVIQYTDSPKRAVRLPLNGITFNVHEGILLHDDIPSHFLRQGRNW